LGRPGSHFLAACQSASAVSVSTFSSTINPPGAAEARHPLIFAEKTTICGKETIRQLLNQQAFQPNSNELDAGPLVRNNITRNQCLMPFFVPQTIEN
jgi:hypothetical protein